MKKSSPRSNRVCRVCGANTRELFKAKVRKRYDGTFDVCPSCGFLQAREPVWLEEAYEESINQSDTGLLARNIYCAQLASTLLYFLWGPGTTCLDYGGGYGVLVRLLRDIGFDCFWQDPMTSNLFARGHEIGADQRVNVVTAFECFEHFADPGNEISGIAGIAPNILFSTILLPDPPPRPEEWWYYGLDHGQHISFYSLRSLEIIARRCGLHFVSNNSAYHLFSSRRVHPAVFRFLVAASSRGLAGYVRRRMSSRTEADMNLHLGKGEVR